MLTLTPGQLTLAQLRQIAQGTDPIALDADCWDNVRASSQAVQAIVAAGEPAYGINTGFGKLAKVHIPREQLEQLQTNLVRSHAVGMGPLLDDACVAGYEHHAGVSIGPALNHPAVCLKDGRLDGALSDDGQLLGTYLHGLFDAAPARDALLRWAGLAVRETPDYRQLREEGIDRLADALEAHLDLRLLEQLLAS